MGHFRKHVITVFLTNQCTCACRYCYVGQQYSNRVPRVIDIDFARVGIKDFFQDCDTKRIRFFADGEPTVEFGLMKEIYIIAERLAGGQLEAEIQTNGVFTEKVCEWLCEYMTTIWISCDGPPYIHDHYRQLRDRTSTSSIVERTIRRLSVMGHKQIGIRSTVGEWNVHVPEELVDYFGALGVQAISVYPLFRPVIFNKHKGASDNIGCTADSFVEFFLKAQEYAKRYGVFLGSILTANFDEEVSIACRAMIPVPHLTTDGFVSCCDMCYEKGGIMDPLIYGSYDPMKKVIIYDEEQIRRIRRRNRENLPRCAKCDVGVHCAGGCVGEALNETGDIYGIKKVNCEITKRLAKVVPLGKGLYSWLNP